MGGRALIKHFQITTYNAISPRDTRAFGVSGPAPSSLEAKSLYAAGWPKDVRPYRARHSVALELGERGIDLGDVEGWLGHKEVTTTRKHYAPVLVSRLKQASETLPGRFGVGGERPTGSRPRRSWRRCPLAITSPPLVPLKSDCCAPGPVPLARRLQPWARNSFRREMAQWLK